MADQNVNVKIRVSKTGTGATDAVKELERVKTTATGMSAGLKSAMGGIAPMFGAMGATFAVSQVVRFGKETVMAASAAQESVNKMNVVFGASSAAITKFSANAARALGHESATGRRSLGHVRQPVYVDGHGPSGFG